MPDNKSGGEEVLRYLSVIILAACLVACSRGSSSPSTASGDGASGGLTQEQLAYQNQLAEEQKAREAAERQARDYAIAIARVMEADRGTNAPGVLSSTVAARMAAIDLTGTPGDFRSAYLDHTEAWRELGRLDDALTRLKSDDSMGQAAVGGILATVFGSDASPFSDQLAAIKQLEDRRPSYDEAVRTTFATVQSVAARYDSGSTQPPTTGNFM